METLAETTTPSRQRSLSNLRPGKLGVSPIPIGGTKLQLQRAAEMHDRVASEFPGITPADALMLWQACGLMAKARNPRLDADLTVRLSGTAHRIITGLQRRYRGAPKPQGADLTDYLKHSEMAPDEGVHETDQ
jgi:hypothetical protein